MTREWEGEMLDRPEMVSAFAGQLRRILREYAEFVRRIRVDAEALWKENPPEGCSSFEAWWRHLWLCHPMRSIQHHLEAAAKETFALEARYQKARRDIPAKRQAKRAGASYGAVTGRVVTGRTTPPPVTRRDEPPPIANPDGPSFLDIIRGGGEP